MKKQSKSPDNGRATKWRALWCDVRLPLTFGLILGVPACALTALVYGLNSTSVYMIANIAGACLILPFVILAISHYLHIQDTD